MRWANEIIKYLPCMKHVEDSPVGWLMMKVPFLEIKMYIHMIIALPMNLVIVYWANKGVRFPLSLKIRVDNLKLVEAHVNHTMRAMDELRKNARLSPKTGSTGN